MTNGKRIPYENAHPTLFRLLPPSLLLVLSMLLLGPVHAAANY